ncbi:MAG: hypothetical protein ABIH21_02830 [Patescibacteria group bacterium]
MEKDINSFIWLLSLIWFIVYWIFGGVLFAVVAITKFGRVRKVRFSCLFTLFAGFIAYTAARFGMEFAHDAQQECLLKAETKAEVITAIFGCGAVGVFGVFILGTCALIIVGFLIMSISKSKSKPWVRFTDVDEIQDDVKDVKAGDDQTDV